MWGVFWSVAHLPKCNAFFQVGCPIPNVARFSMCDAFFQVCAFFKVWCISSEYWIFLESLRKSSDILGTEWSEIFGKSSKTLSLACLYNNKPVHVSSKIYMLFAGWKVKPEVIDFHYTRTDPKPTSKITVSFSLFAVNWPTSRFVCATLSLNWLTCRLHTMVKKSNAQKTSSSDTN